MNYGLLVLLFAGRHYGWMHVPEHLQGDVFSIGASICLIALVVRLQVWWPITAWIVGEELLSIGCSAWWLLDYAPGYGDQCSARLDFKVWSIGLLILAILAYRLAEPVRPSSTKNTQWRIK